MILNLSKYLAVVILICTISSWMQDDPLFSMTSATEVSNWMSTTPLLEELAVRASVEKNDFLYVVGGRQQDNQPSKKVYFARINDDGSLTNWLSTSELPGRGLYLHSLSVTDRYMYLIGGWDRTTEHNNVLRAEFQPDGHLSVWTEITPSYPESLYFHNTVIVNNYIYGIGGRNSSVGLNRVYYAAIDPNTGDFGSWSQAVDLPAPTLYRHISIAHQNFIYVIGGYDSVNVRRDIYRTIVNPDGTLGDWQYIVDLPQPREYHQAIIHDGRLVVMGGRDANGNELSSVIAAPINGYGSLGEWNTLPSLPKTLYRFAAVSIERHNSDFIYVIGGVSGGTKQGTVYHSDVPPPPTATPTNTPTPISTSTPTPTPTPTRVPAIMLDNMPKGEIANGQAITYRIAYDSPDMDQLQELVLTNRIPDGVELVADSIGPNGVLSQDGRSIEWQLTGNQLRLGSVSYQVVRPPIFVISTPKPFFEINKFVDITMFFEGFNRTGYDLYVNAKLVGVNNDGYLEYTFDRPRQYMVTMFVSHDNPHFGQRCSEIAITAIEAQINMNDQNQESYTVTKGETAELSAKILPINLSVDNFDYSWNVGDGMVAGTSTSPVVRAVYSEVGNQIVGLTVTHEKLTEPIFVTRTLTVVDPLLASAYVSHKAASFGVDTIDEIAQAAPEPMCPPVPTAHPGAILNEGVTAKWQFRNRTIETNSNRAFNAFTIYLPLISR